MTYLVENSDWDKLISVVNSMNTKGSHHLLVYYNMLGKTFTFLQLDTPLEWHFNAGQVSKENIQCHIDIFLSTFIDEQTYTMLSEILKKEGIQHVDKEKNNLRINGSFDVSVSGSL